LSTPASILKFYWGYDNFRPQQLSIINAVIEGKDVLTLLPTGAGKSLCFQVPTMYSKGICLVVSPLIALMEDQVKDLQAKNISAIALGSQLNENEQTAILTRAVKGEYHFIYCSPEKLAQSSFQQWLVKIPITLFAIDEAHCISQWGYDFRPSYRKLNWLKENFPKIPVIAMTASAIPVVQEDICKQLGLKQATLITDQFLRPNLSYQVYNVPVKIYALKTLLSNTIGSIIIYCNTRNNVMQLSSLLLAYGFNVGAYHAGIPLGDRKQTQALWMKDQISIIVCTSAFGMGINKGNVRAVIHYDIPSCIEQYYQEAGRAGRDSQAAKAVLVYQNSDWDYWVSVQQKKYPPIETIKKAYQDLADYVQLPIGLGEKQEFIFDFEQFCIQFQWDKIIARNALAWIQQEGHVKFSDASFKPSMVQVLGDRNSLENFENEHPIPGAVLQTLLRTYGGILDSPRYINEKLVGELLQRDAVFVLKNLHFLAQMGIISFEQKEHQPIVAFQWNRSSASFMKLDYDHYQLMKKAFIKRIDQFSQFITGQGISCRSVFLAKYFGEKSPNKCGICDICTTTKE